MRMSDASAMAKPPPQAGPWTRLTIAWGQYRIFRTISVRGGVEIAAARRSEVETRAEGASCPPQQHHTGVGIAGQAVEVLV